MVVTYGVSVDGADRMPQVRTGDQSRHAALNAVRRRNYCSVSAKTHTRHSANQQVPACTVCSVDLTHAATTAGNDLNSYLQTMIEVNKCDLWV